MANKCYFFMLVFLQIIVQRLFGQPPEETPDFSRCRTRGFGKCHVFAGSMRRGTGQVSTFAPRGFHLLAEASDVIETCEDGFLGVLYDCTLKMPLYSAIRMTWRQMTSDESNLIQKSNGPQMWHPSTSDVLDFMFQRDRQVISQ